MCVHTRKGIFEIILTQIFSLDLFQAFINVGPGSVFFFFFFFKLKSSLVIFFIFLIRLAKSNTSLICKFSSRCSQS